MAEPETSSQSVLAPPEISPSLAAAVRRYFAKRALPQEVDDLVQEVVLSMQARRSSAEIQDVERYVFIVAANLLRRRGQLGGARMVPLPDNWDDPTTITPERLLIGRERLRQTREAIAKLPTRTRQVFVLHRFEEMTYRAIASEFGISVSAVEKHIIAALKAIKRALETGS